MSYRKHIFNFVYLTIGEHKTKNAMLKRQFSKYYGLNYLLTHEATNAIFGAEKSILSN